MLARINQFNACKAITINRFLVLQGKALFWPVITIWRFDNVVESASEQGGARAALDCMAGSPAGESWHIFSRSLLATIQG